MVQKNYADFCGQVRKKVNLLLFLIRYYEKNMNGREEI
jgi:hypothetical protein